MILILIFFFGMELFLIVYFILTVKEDKKIETLKTEYKKYIELLKEYNIYLNYKPYIISQNLCNKIKNLKYEIEEQRQRLKELGYETESVFD